MRPNKNEYISILTRIRSRIGGAAGRRARLPDAHLSSFPQRAGRRGDEGAALAPALDN